ncbi:hypothetical protein JTE90_014212 [Oedothorax gibbosus]|uniref:Uncharacterized protein n=1 Tax=Oedothorax gibbosus TaxID=931172 RepID=A0AAV6TCS7_9ARAC|nr:hypothetical protein JTE90_014212 [Oedothorax gibbosus]
MGISPFKPFKSPGVDGIYPVLLQRGRPLAPHLCKIFRPALFYGHYQRPGDRARQSFTPKPGKATTLLPKGFDQLFPFPPEDLEKKV